MEFFRYSAPDARCTGRQEPSNEDRVYYLIFLIGVFSFYKFNKKEKMYTPAIKFENDKLTLIDQTLLPNQLKYIPITTLEECIEAIKSLRVRGAPAIGICAAYGLFTVANSISSKPYTEFKDQMDTTCDLLFKSRPTAVNLGWAISRIKSIYAKNKNLPVPEIIALIKEEAIKIHHEDKDFCEKMGNVGLEIVPNPSNIITHCNAGSLATGGWGTALGVIYAAKEQNYNIHVYVDETRPLGQGARLTLWELMHNDIACTLITDSMSGSLMKDEKIDLVLFGADRISKNGDVANKIGTYNLAALARLHGIPCYAVAPSSTFDMDLESGDKIEIEQRNSNEILHIYGYNDNLRDEVEVYNPAFDVTPAEFLSGIITEQGIIKQPISENLPKLIK
jgi:methylthioribose-1-phosphate isomerase